MTKNAECEYDGGAAPRWTKTLGTAPGSQSESGMEDDAVAPDVPVVMARMEIEDDAARIDAQLRNEGANKPMTMFDMPPPSKQASAEPSRRGSFSSNMLAEGPATDTFAWSVRLPESSKIVLTFQQDAFTRSPV